MKSIRKQRFWIAGITAVFMLLFSLPAFAAENVLHISSNDCQVSAGDSFEVTVTYGGSFSGVDLNITYDPAMVTVEDENSGIENAIISGNENSVFMNASAVKPLSAKNGSLLCVTFKAKENIAGDAGIKVTVKDLFLNNENYEPIDSVYTVENRLEQLGGVTIRNTTETGEMQPVTTETEKGSVSVYDLPENTTITVQDQSTDNERLNTVTNAVKSSEYFKDAEKADILMIVDLSAENAAFVNGKGKVCLPLSESQKDYDSYYVGQEIDGQVVWTKAKVEDGKVVFTTDRLGEVTVVGVNGDNKVSFAYKGDANGSSGSGLLSVILCLAVIAIMVVVIVVISKKKKPSNAKTEPSDPLDHQ